MNKKVIIIGSNHAGTAALNTILDNSENIDVTVFEKNNNVSFLGCGMALWVGNQISNSEGLFYSSKEIMEKKGAKVHMETIVYKIDYDNKKVYYQDKNGENGEEKYDELILATGSSPKLPNIKGIELKNIHVAKRFQDAEEAVRKMQDEKIQHVTVVGAGYIGVELAEAFKRQGKEVLLIDTHDRILSSYYDREFTDLMEEKLIENGIKLALCQRTEKIIGDINGKVKKIITNKDSYETDMILFSIGFKPNSELGENKIKLFKNGAFLVDKTQQTNIKGVYAIGDCSTVYDNSLQEINYIALATNAVRSGVVAALNILGNQSKSLGVQGSSGMCIYNFKMVSTGLTYDKALELGLDPVKTDFKDIQKPLFMNECGENPEVLIRIVFDKKTRVILGAQLASEFDMSSTIHMFSLAIQNQNTIDEIALLDIFFMPHFNQPYNYITMAALSAD